MEWILFFSKIYIPECWDNNGIKVIWILKKSTCSLKILQYYEKNRKKMNIISWKFKMKCTVLISKSSTRIEINWRCYLNILQSSMCLLGKSLLELFVTTFLPDWQLPFFLSFLLQNHMSTIHTIRAHAQEVWDKSDKE